MTIIMTGATGLVGTALTAELKAEGHEVVFLRRPEDWNPDSGFIYLNPHPHELLLLNQL